MEWPPKVSGIYYCDDAVCIIHGDCRDILPQLPQVDLVLTDPPYGIGKAEWDTQDYWKEVLKAFGKMLPSLVNSDGHAIIFSATRHLSFTLEAIKFPYRWQFIWYCPNNMIPGDIGFAKYTSALIFSKASSVFTNSQDLRESPAGTQDLSGNNHPTPKPLPILRYLVEHFCSAGNTILDPFMGSGTTLRAAKDLGRKAIGIEIEERYCEMAAKRMAQTVMALNVQQRHSTGARQMMRQEAAMVSDE